MRHQRQRAAERPQSEFMPRLSDTYRLDVLRGGDTDSERCTRHQRSSVLCSVVVIQCSHWSKLQPCSRVSCA